MEELLAKIYELHPRVAIIGGANTGKTTLSKLCTDRPVFHTDDWAHLPWSDQPDCIIGEIGTLPRFLIEGFITPRVLRKAEIKVDLIIHLTEPYKPWTKRQAAAAKAIDTWMQDVHGVKRINV